MATVELLAGSLNQLARSENAAQLTERLHLKPPCAPYTVLAKAEARAGKKRLSLFALRAAWYTGVSWSPP